MRQGEEPLRAARREPRAELGLEVQADDLALPRGTVVDLDLRRGRVRIFESRSHLEPVRRIDGRGTVAARFVRPRALPAAYILPPPTRARLDGPAASGEERGLGRGRGRRTGLTDRPLPRHGA